VNVLQQIVDGLASTSFFYAATTGLLIRQSFVDRAKRQKLTRQNGQLAQQNQQLNKALLWQQNQLALLGQDVFQSSR
jgi:hypothetical protein